MEKITGNEQMQPVVKPGFLYGDGSYEETSVKGGLTIRQHFAAMAMQGLLSNNDINNFGTIVNEEVICADALIEELNK